MCALNTQVSHIVRRNIVLTNIQLYVDMAAECKVYRHLYVYQIILVLSELSWSFQ